ncbi:MAG: cytochrome-c oxidase, cbb3-type subunit III [Pseudomonadales bacterium]|nr:cytochrome-c oxidase, cbb3-type subunit III [Pseudomonadales bacterium]
MSDGVSLFVIIGTLGSLLFFFLVLRLNKTSGNVGKTTGHIYDGIEEYDNPLPSWWYWMYVLTIVFALGYLAYYPGLGNWKGLGAWSSTGQLVADQEKADAKYGPLFAKYQSVSLADLSKDPAANKMGRRIFANNCTVCHGATAEGSFGFPDLTDSEWIWGGDDAAIKASIMGGRNAAMPPLGLILGESGVSEVSEYVLSLSGREVNEALVKKGAVHFQMYCSACHGTEGKGQAVFGAPDLSNEIWLYGDSRNQIQHIIANGRNGQMPRFEQTLGKDKVHIVAAYVRSLREKSAK